MHAQCKNVTYIKWRKLNYTHFFYTFEHRFTHLCFIVKIKNFQKGDLTEKNIDFKGICHFSFNWTGILDLNSEFSF